MSRKTFACIAAGVLSIVAVNPIANAATHAPAHGAVAYNQIAWFGPYASDRVAAAAGDRITNGLRAGYAVVYQPVDPEGKNRGGGWYVIVTYYS
jgi:hypothetical protein